VLRHLHKCAFTDKMAMTAALLEVYFNFGPEACYHFGGILETARTRSDPDLPWAETLERFAPEVKSFSSVLSEWSALGGRSRGHSH
jgi:hypothetical protein